MKIYIAAHEKVDSKALNLLIKSGHSIIPYEDKKNAPNVEAVFTRTFNKVTKDFLSEFPNIKYVIQASVGMDNIDLGECKRRNITVFNSPGGNANAVAEYTICSMLMLLRHVQSQITSMNDGKWRSEEYIGEELKSKIVGIVGCGMIGRLVAQKLSGFEIPKILGYDPYMTADQLKAIGIEKKELPELLQEADIVTLHLPLTDQTKNLINTKELEIMKPTSYLINTARGGIIHEEAILKALKNQTIRGAALDVFMNEPNVNAEYFTLPNVILTPHIAWMTKEANLQMALIPIKKFLETIQNTSL